MIHKLSNGVEVSEDTIVSALKKAGINVEPPKPKHIFEAGDVAYQFGERYITSWRLIVDVDGKLIGIDRYGEFAGSRGQQEFEAMEYKYIGKLADLLK